jgi:hypothetical protein
MVPSLQYKSSCLTVEFHLHKDVTGLKENRAIDTQVSGYPFHNKSFEIIKKVMLGLTYSPIVIV